MKKLLEDTLLKNVVGGDPGGTSEIDVELLAETNSGKDLPDVIPGAGGVVCPIYPCD